MRVVGCFGSGGHGPWIEEVCNGAHLQEHKVKESESFSLPKSGVIRSLGEGHCYRYLGVNQSLKNHDIEVKWSVVEKYMWPCRWPLRKAVVDILVRYELPVTFTRGGNWDGRMEKWSCLAMDRGSLMCME